MNTKNLDNQAGDISVFDEVDELSKREGYTDEMYDQILESIKVPEIGDTYEAVYVEENKDEYLLDNGFKDLIRVSKNRGEIVFFDDIEVGDLLNVVITDITHSPYSIRGSVSVLYEEKANEILNNIQTDEFVHAYINELTHAGYNCTILLGNVKIDAFMPQILAGVNKIMDADRSKLVGKTLEVCIESHSREKGTWIVSRKSYLKQLIPKYVQELTRDEVYTGVVTGTTTFGVFVEFNECLTGMIHKSNLHPDYQDKISQIEAGTEIDFYVKEVIRNKIILTQIQSTSLWDTIEVGHILIGKIKDHKNFGSLVYLDDETIGLIHTSEITDEVSNMEMGDQVKVRVLAIDRPNRKIFLTTDF